MQTKLLNHWGSDLDVVNNARVSFGKRSEWDYRCDYCEVRNYTEDCERIPKLCHMRPTLKPRDEALVHFLARGCTRGDWNQILRDLHEVGWKDGQNGNHPVDSLAELEEIVCHVRAMPDHFTPFANGIGLKFHIKAPIPVMRQIFKHKIGSVENEISRRYVDDDPEWFYPVWRKKAENVKQGSSEELLDEEDWRDVCIYYQAAVDASERFYKVANDCGVCPEQARFGLLQSMYSEAVVSNSLYGWANFFIQRGDVKHAQKETALVAEWVAEECRKHFPVSWEALTKSVH